MNYKNDIVLDEKSGISIEEQKEILSQINGIAEKNRQQLSGGMSGEQTIVSAKKNGAFFPLAVNITAVVVLAAVASLLILFNGKVEAQVRTGNAVYDLTERALIDEIRKDTAQAIAAKENEIMSIASRLGEVDNELLKLYSSNQELNSEQRAAQERLLAMQSAFREELSTLQDERSQILENSRTREARLRAQMDERAREFAAAQQRAESELDSAMRELERLTTERERLMAVEALFSGGLAVLSEQTRVPDQSDHLDLMTRNTQLQSEMDELRKTIDALSSGGSGLNRRISELQELVSSLEQGTAEKDSRITSLEAENTNNTSTINQLRNENNTKDQRIADLNTQLTAIRQLLQDN